MERLGKDPDPATGPQIGRDMNDIRNALLSHSASLVLGLSLGSLLIGCGAGSGSQPTPDSEHVTGNPAPETVELIASSLGDELHSAGVESELAEWSWVRPTAGGYRIEDSSLELRSSPGTLWGGQNTLGNIALRATPSQVFTVEVTVDGEVSQHAEQAGLVLYSGDDDYLKLVRELVGGQRVVIFAREAGGSASVVQSTPLGQNAATLRLTVTSDGVSAALRRDSAGPWEPAGQTTLPRSPVHVGLFSHGGPSDRWATLSSFRLSP